MTLGGKLCEFWLPGVDAQLWASGSKCLHTYMYRNNSLPFVCLPLIAFTLPEARSFCDFPAMLSQRCCRLLWQGVELLLEHLQTEFHLP